MEIVNRSLKLVKELNEWQYTVYLYIHHADKNYPALSEKYKQLKTAYVNKDKFITTTYKTIIDNNWEEDLAYLVPEPLPDHYRRITLELILKESDIIDTTPFDYVEIIHKPIENDQLVMVDILENDYKTLEHEVLRYKDQILPLACSKKVVIISGIVKDIREKLKPLFAIWKQK